MSRASRDLKYGIYTMMIAEAAMFLVPLAIVVALIRWWVR